MGDRDPLEPALGQILRVHQIPPLVGAVTAALASVFLYGTMEGHNAVLVNAGTPMEAEAIHSLFVLGEVSVAMLALGAVALALSSVILTRRCLHAIEDRMEHVSALAGTVLTGGVLLLSDDQEPPDDSIGHLQNKIRSIAGALAERDATMQDDAFRQSFDGMIQRAMTMAESEADIYALTQRALEKTLPHNPSELLVAAAAGGALDTATSSRLEARPCCPVSRSSDCQAARRGHTIRFDDASAIDACPMLLDRAQPAHSAVCIPLPVMGHTVGVLHTTSASPDGLSPSKLRDVEALVRHAGARLGMIRALETTKFQAETDPLTGLLNRRSLETRCKSLFASDTVCAVAMCDLDHFKRLNDTHGHDAGDRALRLFSQVLRQSVRPTDFVARFGGEEFVLVLPGSTGDAAVVALERIRSGLLMAIESGGGPAFTCSIGVAAHPNHASTLEDLVQAADQALYSAKSDGRDRIVLVGATSDATALESVAPPPPPPVDTAVDPVDPVEVVDAA